MLMVPTRLQEKARISGYTTVFGAWSVLIRLESVHLELELESLSLELDHSNTLESAANLGIRVSTCV